MTTTNRSINLDLTIREIEVLRWTATGIGAQGVADRLILSRNTVRTHIQRILLKLRAANITHAVALAKDAHII